MPAADMGRQEAAENAGLRRQGLQRDFPQGLVVVHEEQQSRHKKRHSADIAMPRLIRRKIAFFERLAKRRGLPKGEAETLARDRVDGGGGIPDEGYPPERHATQPGGFWNMRPLSSWSVSSFPGVRQAVESVPPDR